MRKQHNLAIEFDKLKMTSVSKTLIILKLLTILTFSIHCS